MKKKVALFDFDNTVATGDSIVRLLKYDIKKHPLHIFYFVKVALYYGLYLLHLSSFEKAKATLLFPLLSMNDDDLKAFYEECIVPTYYLNVVEEMQIKKDQGYFIILCTASIEAYMQYHQLPVDKLIGTQIKRVGKKWIPELVDKNCKKHQKVRYIENYLKSCDIEIDYENSYGYSDSNDDIPMLQLVKHKKRVLLKTGKIVDFQE
ncbi:MAG: HAD family hydrolase [Coprobacillus sp.]